MALSVERPKEPPKDHTGVGLSVAGKANAITIPDDTPSPFGNKLPKLEANLRVMGPMPDFRKKESLAAWNNAFGVVEFDKLNIAWGPLILSSKGTLGFDDDLQPEGAFSGEIGNHQEVLKALLDHGYIEQRQAGMLDSALSLFAKPTKLGEDTGIEVPITVQLGGMYLGPVRVFVFPDLDWSNNPAKQ